MTEPTTLTARNLAADLDDRAAEAPDRLALVYEDGRQWTFGELNRRASAAADALERAGARRGSRVAYFVPNGPELVFLLYGAWKLGAVPVTVSALYNASELEDALAKTRPLLLLTSEGLAEIAAEAAGDLPRYAIGAPGRPGLEPLVLEDDAGERPAVAVGPDDEAVILFTGGTTGRPKAVSVTHGAGHTGAAVLARAAKGRPGPYSVAPPEVPPNVVALPLFHSGGQFTLRFAFHVGRAAILLSRFRVDTLARVVAEQRPDNLFLLPTMVYDVVHADPPPDLSSVRSVLIAGQAISPQLQRTFEERFRIPIAIDYGSTEIGQVAGWTARDRREGRWKPGSVGRVFEGVAIEIRDADGRALPQGETGEIVVRSAHPPGYVDDEDATRELVVDGWVHSGDVGYVDEDGVLFIVGRKREMIKCGGFQVWPQEIEDELRAHPAVRDVRVVGAPHDRLGEIPRAQVVREPGAEQSDDELRAQLIAFARERLAHFKAPREVAFVAELPRSEVGKVRRGAQAGESDPL